MEGPTKRQKIIRAAKIAAAAALAVGIAGGLGYAAKRLSQPKTPKVIEGVSQALPTYYSRRPSPKEKKKGGIDKAPMKKESAARVKFYRKRRVEYNRNRKTTS